MMSFLITIKGRSSRPDVFIEKGVLRNFAKFTGKHLCQSLFFNKVAGGCLQIFLKKEALAQLPSCCKPDCMKIFNSIRKRL